MIRSTILAMLPAGRARSALRDGGIDASTRLLDVGLIDSDALAGHHSRGRIALRRRIQSGAH